MLIVIENVRMWHFLYKTHKSANLVIIYKQIA